MGNREFADQTMYVQKELSMTNKRLKVAIVILVSACFAGSIFSAGCAMDRKPSGVSSADVLVMDLSRNPEYQQLLTGKPQTCGMRSGRVYLQPGESIGQHSTKAHEELIVFLSGKGTALIGDPPRQVEIGQGKVAYVPPHTTHNMKNTGTEPFVYIYCVAPVRD